MYNLNKKQKILLGILVAIVAGFIYYYVHTRDNESSAEIDLENNVETQEKEEYSDDRILVHVSGAVNKEGIVELKTNSRIADAIDKAGGVREDANMHKINLAYPLEDGMKVEIPTKQEKQNEANMNDEDVTTSSGCITGNEETEEQTNTRGQKVNINTATQAQLETLPGIGPSTAIKIIEHRKEKGKFTQIEDIKEVKGIGDSKYNKIKDLISTK